MLSDNGKAAGNKVKTWNENYPANPITFNDVSFRAMLKYFENKLTRKIENKFIKGTPGFKKGLSEEIRKFRKDIGKKPIKKTIQQMRGN